MQNIPIRSVVFVIVPPMRFEKAILMLVELPLMDREMDSKISGISEAIGARKKARRVGLTSMVTAKDETALMKGSEQEKMRTPPTAKYPIPFQRG